MKLSLFLTILVSCSGYRFKNVSNPLAQYEIKSVTVPMFINRSSLPNISGPFTSTFVKTLSQYPDLNVKVGEKRNADALLLGIIYSHKNHYKTLNVTKRKFTNESMSGKRKRFLIPITTEIAVSLRLILIKNPTLVDIKLLKSNIGPYLNAHPKIIFNEVLQLKQSFDRLHVDSGNADSAGTVNFTRNQGALELAKRTMAESAANTFRELILYAF